MAEMMKVKSKKPKQGSKSTKVETGVESCIDGAVPAAITLADLEQDLPTASKSHNETPIEDKQVHEVVKSEVSDLESTKLDVQTSHLGDHHVGMRAQLNELQTVNSDTISGDASLFSCDLRSEAEREVIACNEVPVADSVEDDNGLNLNLSEHDPDVESEEARDDAEIRYDIQIEADTEVKAEESASMISDLKNESHAADSNPSVMCNAEEETCRKLPLTSFHQPVHYPSLTLGDLMSEAFPCVTANRADVINAGGIMCQAIVESSAPPLFETRPKQLMSVTAARARTAEDCTTLYPPLRLDNAVQVSQALKPLTEQQLRSLYYNHEMEHLDEFVDSFLVQAQQERHEFYQILLCYYQARNSLSGSEKDINVLQTESQEHAKGSWETVAKTVTLQGTCVDKSKVSGELTFNVAAFKECECDQLDECLKKIRTQINDNLTLHAYEADRSRLQVECYIYRLYARNPALRNIPPNSPVRAYLAHQRDASLSHQVEALKLCISVLFMFQRKPTNDDVFLKATRHWLSIMVATLLRVATLEDHLFLLCHVLRCPAGISKWAAGYIQIVAPPSAVDHHGWDNPILDHSIAMLSMILNDIRDRDKILFQMKITPMSEKTDVNPWILVDEDGEEDEDPSNSWLYFQENDIVTLLNQFSIDVVIRHILYIKEQDGHLLYDISHTSETGMSKLFAFVSCVIRMLGYGLQNFTLGRYRQINKRLGRMARHIVQYTCDHWSYFKETHNELPMASLQRLQLELDMVLQRAVICILSAHRLGAWQFLTELPYEAASTSMLWTLVWLMHKGCCTDEDLTQLESHIGVEIGHQRILDDIMRLEFFDKLVRLPAAEVTFLLITFTNMARLRPASERNFIEEIAREIFEISYINNHTREFCKKSGREYLYSICTKHPFIMSFLLQNIDKNLDKIGSVSYFLYLGLPLCQWVPTDSDMKTLRRWLVESSTKSTANQLARIIIDGMNFGLSSESGRLFLDRRLHRQMAVMLMDTYIAHLSAKPIGRLFLEISKQTTPSGKTVNDDSQLAQWAWSVTLRLHLHANSVKSQQSQAESEYMLNETVGEFIDLTSDASLGSIVKGLLSEQRYSLACYLALVMTKCGHSVKEFCEEGVQHLCHLVEKLLFVPALNSLFYTTPLFFYRHTALTSNDVFMNTLKVLITADTSQKSYFGYATGRSIGKTFAGMVESQMRDAEVGDRSAKDVVLFWLNVLTGIEGWSKEKDVVCIIDDLIKSSFCRTECLEVVLQFFIQITKTVSHDQPGMLSSIVTWIGVGSRATGSLIDRHSTADITWYSYAVINAECLNQEETTGLWTALLQQLYTNEALTVDQALAKAVASQRVDSSFGAASLAIYRWAELAVNTPHGHPLLPILMQRFMLLYLGRPVLDASLSLKESMGDRLFNTNSHRYLIKQLKKYLSDASAHCQKSASTNQFQKTLSDLYQSLSFWLDEPRLHSSNLYMPSLPAQYQTRLLEAIFKNNKGMWLEFVDIDGLREEFGVLRRDWITLKDPEASQCQAAPQAAVDPAYGMSPADRILSRMEHITEKPLKAPEVEDIRSPVPELNPALLCDQQNLFFALHSNFSIIVEHAKIYSMRVSRHVALDCSFMELVPKLYKNVRTESTIHLQCSRTFNPTHRCKGPALVTHLHEQEKLDELIYRRIEENRATYKQLIIESLLAPPQNVCAAVVYIESAITNLINLLKSTPNQSTALTATSVGIALFFTVSTYISDEIKYYPPSRQFFASCIEVLGQEFIRNNPSQSQPLLQAILQTPSLTGLLAPNFCPNKSPELFVAMYEDLLHVPSRQGVDVAYTLLTKFDIPSWLESYKPGFSMREELIERILGMLTQCGKDPHNSLRMIFEIYRVHLQQVLNYQFPGHFSTVLKLLLKGSAAGQISVKVWCDFLACIGWRSTEPDQAATQEGQYQIGEHTLVRVRNVMSYSQVSDNCELLSSHFLCLRLSSADSANFGLYAQWKMYTSYLGQLFSYLTTSATLLKARASTEQTIEAETALYELYNMFVHLFSPWIQPLNSDGQLLQPCVLNDIKLFSDFVNVFVETVDSLHKSFKDCMPVISCQVYSLLWTHYLDKIARQGVPDHILAVYHSRLLQLQWNNFFPDIQAIENMMKMIDYPKICFEFLANVISQMEWSSIVQFYEAREVAQIVIRLHVCLFTVLLHIAADKALVESTSLAPLLTSTTIFNWTVVDGKSYNAAVDWFIKSCDPKCVMAERTSASAHALNLIKISSGFHAGSLTPVSERRCSIMNSIDNTSSVKRQCYVRCVAQLVSRCSFVKNINVDSLRMTVNNLLTDIERTVGYLDDPHIQYQESVSLCSEVLRVLNSCSPEADFSAALVDWITSSSLSRLLFPLMTSACRRLANHYHMAYILEACIEAHFSVDVTATDFFGWTRILAVMELPDRNCQEFLLTAVKAGCYLVVYAYVLQQLPMSMCLADELKHITALVTWHESAKSSLHETNESKLFLLWHKVLELSSRQLELGGDTKVIVRILVNFTSTLSALCEDKSSQGIFGFLGLGKKSSLSVRFRLVAKGLMTFLSAQLPSDSSLRVSPSAPGHLHVSPPQSPSSPPPASVSPSQQAVQALSHLESLRTNKQYSAYRQHLELILSLVLNPTLTIKDSTAVLSKLVAPLFPELHFLGVVRHEQQQQQQLQVQ